MGRSVLLADQFNKGTTMVMRSDAGRNALFVFKRNRGGRKRRGVALAALGAVALVGASCTPEPEGPATSITVTASSHTITYGDAVPEITPSYSSNPGVPATCSTTATQASPPGIYPTICQGASDPNLMIAYQDGTVTIKPAPVTVTASSTDVTYGDSVPAISASYAGLKLGATQPATLATCSTSANASSPAGSYATTCSGAADPNYTFTYVDGSLQISKAAVSVTASSGSHVYGSSAPAVTAQYIGLQGGQSAPTTPAHCSSDSDSHSAVGTYSTSCSGAADPNYSFNYVNGSMAVTPAPLSITASSASMVAGGSVPVITPIYSGLVNGDSAPAVPPVCSTTATSASGPGTYPSSCDGASDPNYSITYLNGSVTVTAANAPVVVTASSATVTFGDSVPAITASYSGLAGNPATAPVCTTTATAASAVGTYPTSCSGAADPAHTFTYVNGTITIVAAPVTVKASSSSKVYGAAPSPVSATYTGLKGGATQPATPATCSTSAVANSPVGSYPSSCSGAVDANYFFTYVNGTVTVTKAGATVTASNATFEAGQAVPAISASYSGLLFGQTQPASAPTCSTDATSASTAGTYSSTCAGASDPNYSLTYVNGVVTVTAPTLPTPVVTGYAGYSTITRATQVSAASNGKSLPQGSIDVVATAGFSDYTNLTIVSSSGAQNIFCKNAKGSSTRLQGCEGGTGVISTGATVTDAAMNTFDVYTIAGGASSVEPSSLKILNDVPAAFRGMNAQVNATAQFGLVTSLITPGANGSFSLLFGICNKGTPVFSASNPQCRAGEIIYSPGAISTMGAQVKVGSGLFSATSNVYQKLHTAVTAPASVKVGDTFTVYAAAAGSSVPKANSSSVGDATINYARDLSIVFPVPAGMQYVSASAMGGDARTSGQVVFTYCPTASSPGCIAKTTGNYDQTTVPYVQVSFPSSFQVPGGASMTVPTVGIVMKATGTPGTVSKATMTQFNLTTNVNAPIIGNQNARFEGYPTDDSNPDATPPKKPPAVLGTVQITN